jgi:hypothetical protein
MARQAAHEDRPVLPLPRRADQLDGRRLIRLIDAQLRQLHAQRAHGNRSFFYDQLVTAHLLAFFNPVLHSLRRIEDAFDLPAVRRFFDVARAPKSTVADAQRLFDPQLLRPIFEDLKRRAKLQSHDRRLDALTRELTAVDGTFFAVAGRIAWAVYNRRRPRRRDGGGPAGARPAGAA